MKTIEKIGKPGVALLNPFRGAFHGGAKDFLSETETRKNHGIRRQRTSEKGHPGMRWRHRKRCVWRHVRTFEPRKKAGERNKFSTLSDSQPPGGLLDNSNTLESPCKKFNFRQRKNIEKGHRKSVASRHRQHHTQGAFRTSHARMPRLEHRTQTNGNPYQKHTAIHPLCQTQSHPQASP